MISSELCSVPSPRLREICVPQICTHMPGLKDVHKDLAEMIRKISFIALSLPRRSPTLPRCRPPSRVWPAFEFDHVQTYITVQCPRPSPSIVPRGRGETDPRRLKSCQGRARLFSLHQTCRASSHHKKKPFQGRLDHRDLFP